MKLHLPVKLRASLIAAVIAVSASVYNAHGATQYKTAYGANDYIVSDTPAMVSGNIYNGASADAYDIAGTDSGGNPTTTRVAKYNDKWYVVIGNQLTDTEWTGTIDANTNLPEGATLAGTDKSEFVIKLAPGSEATKVEFKGNTQISVDIVKLESSVTSPATGVEGKTTIEAKDALNVGSSASGVTVALENIDISAGGTELLGGSSLSIDNSAAGAAANEIDLGSVSGEGSLAITGGVYDDAGTEKKTAVELDGVDLTGNIGLNSTDATITGDVDVNRLTLTGSDTSVQGSVTTTGNAEVDADSSLTASGDIATNTNGTGSIVVAGSVTSTGGKVTLDQGTVTGSVTAETGDVTLSNTDVTDGASIEAGGSLNLTGNTTIVDQADDNGTPDDTTDDNAGITVNVGGDLNVIGGDPGVSGDDKTIISGVTAIVGGNVDIAAGADQVVDITGTTLNITGGGIFDMTGDGDISLSDSNVKGASSVTVAEGKDVSNTNFTDVTGQVTIGGTIEGGSIAGAQGDAIDGIEISGADASITGTTITGNEGNVSVTGGATVTDSSIAGAADVTVGVDSAVSGTTITDVTGAITVDGTLEGSVDADGNTINATVEGGTDLTVNGEVADTDFSGLTGKVTVTGSIEGGSIAGTDADKLDGIEISGADASITGTTITGNEGNVSVTGGATVTDSSIAGAADVTVGVDSVVSGTTITGNEGDITVDAGSFTNSTIEGGEHLSISAADITGSDITGITGDIKITGTTFAGTDEDKIELITKGTSATVGHDAVEGGSIIIDNSSLANAIITSGRAPATGESPSGDITITVSNIAASEISTANGNVSIQGGLYSKSTDGSYTEGKGVDKANISTVSFTQGLTAIGVSPDAKSLDSISVEEQGHDGQTTLTGVTVTLKKGNQVIATSEPTNLTGTQGNMATFTFSTPVEIIPGDTDYSLEFSTNVRAVMYNDANKPAGATGQWNAKITANALYSTYIADSTVNTGAGDVEISDMKVSTSSITTGTGDVEVTDSAVVASTITTAEGGLTLTGSTVSSATIAGTDDAGNATEEYTKSILSATADSSIVNSSISGADVTIDGGSLSIDASTLAADVNIEAGDVVVINGTTINIDGGAARDASIISGKDLNMGAAGSLAGNAASIANADVQVEDTTSIYGADTINLTNVYKVVDAGKAASTLGIVNNTGDAAAAAKLNITGSLIDMEAIHANGGGDGTDASKYFGTVDVKKDSTVNIAGDALVEYLKVNIGWGDTSATQHSSVVIGGDASIKELSVLGEGGNTYVTANGQGGDGPEVTIKGNASIGTLKVSDEGVLSLVGDGSAVSTIAGVGKVDAYAAEPHGVINVVGGQLTTPTLNVGSWMSVGLNGATIILGDVAAVGDAIAASSTSVNAHVKLRDLTDAHQTGVDQLDVRSTIKTSGLTRLTSAATSEAGTSTAVEGAKAYMYKVNCGQGNTATVAAGMNLYKQDAATGAWVALAPGSILNDGELVAKFNYEYTTTTLETGAVINTGATVNESLAGLTDAEDDILVPLTSALGGTVAGGTVTIDGKDYVVSAQGHLTVAVDASFMAGASATLGTVETKDDGIASLTVARDFSANKTDITAYELATVAKYWKGGNEITVDAYNALDDAGKAGWLAEYVAVDGTGYIQIGGKLTGVENKLTADKDITVTGGIEADNNELTSNTGSITTGAITGTGNKLTATEGTIITGAITGGTNELEAKGDVTVNGAVAGDNTITSAEGDIETGAISGTNTLTATEGTITAAAISGGTNTLDAKDDVTVTGSVAGDNTITSTEGAIATGDITSGTNTLTATEGTITAAAISGGTNTLDAKGDVTVTGSVAGDNTITSAEGAIATGEITSGTNMLTATEGTITAAAISGGTNTLDAKGDVTVTGSVAGDNTITSAEGVIETGDITSGTNTLTATEGTITTGAITGGTNTLDAKGDVTVDGSVAGDNTITSAEGIITVDGNITGTGNELTATEGTITVTGDITDGGNTLTADNVVVVGALEGDNNKVDAGVISLGAVAGNEVEIISSGVAVTADNAIEIGELSATDSIVKVEDAADSVGSISIDSITAVDPSAIGTTGNIITTPQGDVTIGTLTDANAKTTIEVGSQYSITVAGEAGQTAANTASNQNWKAGKLAIAAESGLSLTDSKLAITGGVEGTSLTLTSSTLDATDVDLDALSIAGNAKVKATTVEVEDLTIAGTKATLETMDLTVTGELTLRDGAKLDGQNVSADTLVLENSDLVISELDVEGLVLKGSTAQVTNGLTALTDQVRAEALNGEASSLTTSEISTSSQVVADASTIKTMQGGISAANGVVATNGGSISSIQNITSANAGVTAENGGSISAEGNITAGTTVKADGGSITAKGDITTGSMEITNGGSITADDVTLSGELNASGGKLTADSVSGATGATLSNATITGALEASGEVSAAGGSIGSITGTASKVELTNMDSMGSITMATTGDLVVSGTETGAVNAANGNTVANATLTNATIGSGLNVTNNMTTTGDVTVEGDVTVGKDLAVNTGTLSADNVKVEGTTTLTNGKVDVEGTFHSTMVLLKDIDGEMAELKADKGLSLSGSDLDVTITGTGDKAVQVDEGGMSLADGATVTNKGGASIAGGLTVDDATFTNKGGVAVTGKTEVSNGGTLTGASLTTDGLTADGAVVSIDGDLNLTEDGLSVTNDAEVTAKGITNAGAVVVKDGGKLTADSVSGATSATLSKTTIAGELAMTGTDADVTADGSGIGSITGANDVTLENQAEVGSITMSGALEMTNASAASVSGATSAELSNATIAGELAAGATEVLKDTTVGSATVGALKVATGASLTADGAVVTNGDLDIAGKVVSKTGDITLAGDGKVSADVTAAAGTLSIKGELDAAEVSLTGKTVDIDGTLNAGHGVSLVGTVTGDGSIVKTGGDVLVLAGDTKIGGVQVVDSKLDAAAGAQLGALKLEGSTMQIAGEKNMGPVYVNGGSIDAGSVVVADVKLGQRAGSDQIINNGTLNIDGAKLKINDLGTNEANVADGTSYNVVTGTVTGSFAADVEHGYDTLNVHAEGGDIVFSKNYKGAADKTENQAATADALAAMPAVKGELASVMDALAHTRSEADALKALDSLSGAGLAVAPKLIADETKEHLQTLRSTIQSVAAGLQRRYSAEGVRLSNVESTAVSAAVTGGSSTVKEDGNAGEYTRDSMGAMFTVAHAINDEWTFGAAVSFTQGDAECGTTTLESQGVFLDVGVMQKRGRFSQMGSIGAAFFSIDTERTVGVNALGHGYAGTAEGSTDAAAFTMSYETSYAIWQTKEYSLSSVVMAEMLFAQVDNMEEKGLGNAGLRSSYDDVAAFTIGAGARYTYHFGEERNPGYIALEAMAVADTGDSTTKVNNTFIGGGNSFQLSSPEAGNYGLRLNAGVLLPLGDQWGLFGNATGEFRSEQTTVGGSLGVKCAF